MGMLVCVPSGLSEPIHLPTPGATPQKELAARNYKGKIYQTHGVANPDFLRVVGKDGNGATYGGDSVALDFLGQPLSSEGGGERVETAVLDLESLQAYRRSFPAQLDADHFELLP